MPAIAAWIHAVTLLYVFQGSQGLGLRERQAWQGKRGRECKCDWTAGEGSRASPGQQLVLLCPQRSCLWGLRLPSG